MTPPTTDRTTEETAVQAAGSLTRDRKFLRLWGAQTLCQLGVQTTEITLPLVAVLALHASAFEVGALASFQMVAFLLIGLPAGAWMDRVRKRPVLVAASVGRAALLASVPVAGWLDVLTVGQMFGVAFGLGVCTVFFETAYQSYLPSLVGPEQLLEGNAKLESSRSVSQVAGPSAGGWLAQWLTAPTAVVVNAAGFLAAALLMWRIDDSEDRPVSATTRRGMLGEIRQGLTLVFGDRVLRAITLSGAVFNLSWAVTSAMLVLFLQRDLGLSAGAIGFFFAAAGLAAVGGSVLVRPVTARLGVGPAMWLGAVVVGLLGLAVPLADHGWRFWLAGVAFAALNAGLMIVNVNSMSCRQQLCPPGMLGRMSATIRFVMWGVLPVGGVLGGLVADAFTVRAALWTAALTALLAFVPLALSPLRTDQRWRPAGR
ncbi:MFS transporter [Streptomyces sp. NK08204]|uniref:MFS transporter n=1 Tax=Streptomyces sp. NK08204 TaxID=2873260 RepID=UPI001CECDAF1|nr:MFS transporter [Streptomyces sp. NK08204]